MGYSRLIRLVLAATLVSTATAGCLGTPDGPPGTDVPSTEPSSTLTSPTDPSSTDRPSTDHPSTGHPSLRLELYSKATENLSVRIATISDDGNETVFEETYPPEVGEVILNDVFDDGTAYRVTISVAGEIVWHQQIADYEGYRLVVQEDGTVTEESYVEA